MYFHISAKNTSLKTQDNEEIFAEEEENETMVVETIQGQHTKIEISSQQCESIEASKHISPTDKYNGDINPGAEQHLSVQLSNNPPEESSQSAKLDPGIVPDHEDSPHYKLGDEPEPLDLTHLNIEAAILCLSSKVRVMSGARSSSDHDTQMRLPEVTNPNSEAVEDWAEEVRPSMRKLRQGMDSLLKSTRMMCSVLRLEQSEEAVRLTAEIKQRRDICFSQALTSLVSSLVTRLWCHPPDPVFISILSTIGPLVCFEGLLSMHGEDVTIYNDMMVAVEDLRAVEFTLVLVENMKQSHQQSQSSIVESVSNFPLPRVTGSRAQLKVLLPVPAWVLQFRDSQATSFSITPVFFNIGINEHATIAEKLGNNLPQEKNNSDNYKILSDYVRRYKKMNLFSVLADSKDNNPSMI